MKKLSKSYNRDVSRRKALRKKKIAEQIYDGDYYNNLHQYSKNKIHCSCPLCSAKTRNKGKINYKVSDYKKIERLENEREEYDYEEVQQFKSIEGVCRTEGEAAES